MWWSLQRTEKIKKNKKSYNDLYEMLHFETIYSGVFYVIFAV